MSNLIYILLVLISIAIFASSGNNWGAESINMNLDLANFNLSNYSDHNYQAVLSGTDSYTFNLPPSGKQTVNIKEGKYEIKVYLANAPIAQGSIPPALELRAQFNITISSADLLKLSITNTLKLNDAFKANELSYSRN